jgi:hypothetical protein
LVLSIIQNRKVHHHVATKARASFLLSSEQSHFQHRDSFPK